MYYGLYCFTRVPDLWGTYDYRFNRTRELLFRPQPNCESRSILVLIDDPNPRVLTVHTTVGSGLDYFKAHAPNHDP